MTLKDFIDQVGQNEIAKELDVTQQAVSMWRNRGRIPMVKKIYHIVKMSKGLVSYAEVIEPYMKNQYKKQNKKT